MQRKKPNILLVTSHDTGCHFGCYGNTSVATPNIDRLAGEGVLFTGNFCTAPLCSPSRGSIITGRYPCSHGLMGLLHRGWDIPGDVKSIPLYLKEGGYETFLFGFQHERQDPVKSGYEHIVKTSLLYKNVADSFIQFLNSGHGGKPFFASLGCRETHLPFDSPAYQPDKPGEVFLPAYLRDNPATRLEMARFHGLVKDVDFNTGRIMEALKEKGLEEETLFIQTTDHGIPFPRAKSTLYDPGIKTAFIMKWPGGLPRGRVCGELVSNVDILPTLLEIAGLPVPEDIQGKSLLPFLSGERNVHREEIFAQKDWHDHYDPVRCIRTPDYKYILNFEKGPALKLPLDIAESLAARSLPEEYRGQRQPEELYELKSDPGEFRNLAEDPSFGEIKRVLRQKLYGIMEDAGDKLAYLTDVRKYWKHLK